MDDQLKQYYEESFAPNNLPDTHRKPFEQIDADLKHGLENSMGFAGWKLQRATDGLGQSIKDAIAPVSTRTAFWVVGGMYILIRIALYLIRGE